MLRRLLILSALVLTQVGCSGESGCGDGSAACTRVLFVGNSYTQVNDLPTMFATLASSGGHGVETGTAAEGGATLAEHAASTETATKLAAARWDVVVLQEQSQIPSVEQVRQAQMYPAAHRSCSPRAHG